MGSSKEWRNKHGTTHAQRAEANYIQHVLDNPIMRWVCQEIAYHFSHRSPIWNWEGAELEYFGERYEHVRAKLAGVVEETGTPYDGNLLAALEESSDQQHKRNVERMRKGVESEEEHSD